MIKFTKDEKIVLIFLLASLFIGTAVSYYRNTNPHTDFVMPDLDEHTEANLAVNINTANEKELIKLKNIGPVLAGRIIAYREKHGSFRRTEDIKNVKGIGEKTYEKIRNQITLKDYTD